MAIVNQIITLRRFEDKDIDLFKLFLEKEHVKKWYTDPDDWLYEVNNRNSEFNWIKHFIVLINNIPIGFCQYYIYLNGGENWYPTKDKGVFSIDYLIGDEEYLHKGYGKMIIQELLIKISQEKNAKEIVVKPDKENITSRMLLLKSGFAHLDSYDVYLYKII